MTTKEMPPLAEAALEKEEVMSTSYANSMNEQSQELVSFTLYTKKGGNLTKSISLDPSGNIQKDSGACFLSEGVAEIVTMPFRELMNFFVTIKPNQAVGWGLFHNPYTKICSISRLSQSSGYLARTRENCFYQIGLGVVLFDNDCGMDNYELLENMEAIVPGLKEAAKIIKPSVSAGLYRKSTGEKLPGQNNAHIYVLVKDASDIPRFGEVLHKRLIMAGHGRVEFAKDGKILIRTLVDQFVHQPERLDFAAPPILTGDLEQRLPEIIYIPGNALETIL